MKLKPCPFCGQQPKSWWDIQDKEGYNIYCCYINISKIYKEEAEKAWNSRWYATGGVVSNEAIFGSNIREAIGILKGK